MMRWISCSKNKFLGARIDFLLQERVISRCNNIFQNSFIVLVIKRDSQCKNKFSVAFFDLLSLFYTT